MSGVFRLGFVGECYMISIGEGLPYDVVFACGWCWEVPSKIFGEFFLVSATCGSPLCFGLFFFSVVCVWWSKGDNAPPFGELPRA